MCIRDRAYTVSISDELVLLFTYWHRFVNTVFEDWCIGTPIRRDFTPAEIDVFLFVLIFTCHILLHKYYFTLSILEYYHKHSQVNTNWIVFFFNRPRYIMAFSPVELCSVKQFFSSGPGTMRRLHKSPYTFFFFV